jgi:hypothetical protein
MATFDVNMAAGQARTGAIPPGWQVFPLRAVAAWVPVVLAVFMALLMVVLTIVSAVDTLSTGEVWAPAILLALAGNSDTGVFFIWIGEMVAFLAFAAFLAILGIRSLGTALHREKHFLLVAPEGFAEVRGNKVNGASYADVRGMQLVSNGASLEIMLQGAKPLTINIGAYGSAKTLYATLLSNARAAQQEAKQQ